MMDLWIGGGIGGGMKCTGGEDWWGDWGWLAGRLVGGGGRSKMNDAVNGF